jgi:DNA-binding transcriptional regulator YhcF (GntR family)
MVTGKTEVVDANSKIPKYLQVANSFIEDIVNGDLKMGERLPSILETSRNYYLSKETIEKAYNELYRQGFITSIYRKGYFVTNSNIKYKTKIFLLIGAITSYNKSIYNSLAKNLPEEVQIDIHIYNYKKELFRKLIAENIGNYHYYILVPHLIENDENIEKLLKKIPERKLIMLDCDIPGYNGEHFTVSGNSQLDIFSSLSKGIEYLKKYKLIKLVLAEEEFFHLEILTGFQQFCEHFGIDFVVMDGLDDDITNIGEAYFVLDDNDLVIFVKRANKQGFNLGSDVGVISYNDAPYKEILSGGISVITSYPDEIGKNAAGIILHKRQDILSVSSDLIQRQSL